MYAATIKSKAINAITPILYLIILYYPMANLGAAPFGGGGRYLSVLAGPISLLFIIFAPSTQASPREQFEKAFAWLLPFMPFAIALTFSISQDGNLKIYNDFTSRLLWGSILFLATLKIQPKPNHIISATAIGCIIYGLFSLWDLIILHHDRAEGGGNSIHFGYAAMWLSGLTLIGFCKTEEKNNIKSFWLAAATTGIAASFLSGTRGAFLALIPLYYTILQTYPINQRYRANKILTIAILALASAFIFYPTAKQRIIKITSETKQFFTEESFTETSIGTRLALWEISIESFKKTPLTGTGKKSPEQVINILPNTEKIPSNLKNYQHFHSDWFQSLATGGLILTLAQTLTIFFLIKKSNNSPFLLWTILSAITFSLTDQVFHQKIPFSLFVSIWAIYSASHEKT